jgi:hypothetical protein
MCKEMPVIPINKVVDKKRIIWKKGAEEEEKALGVADPKKCPTHLCWFHNKSQNYYMLIHTTAFS